MPRFSQQKLKPLYILRILREASDEEHPLDSFDLIAELEKYDIGAERKSIYSDIEHLIGFGVDIVQTRQPKRGWFLASRDYEAPEVRLLIDAVQSASFITPKKTRELLEKLELEVSKHQARELKQQAFMDTRLKSANEEIYYIMDVIQRAIMKKQRVQFYYYRREVGGRVARNKGRPFTVSPYAMIWTNNHYYLVCSLSTYNTLSHYRLDRMEKVTMTEKPIRGFEEVCEYIVVSRNTQTMLSITPYNENGIYNLETHLRYVAKRHGVFTDFALTNTAITVTLEQRTPDTHNFDATVSDVLFLNEVKTSDCVSKVQVKTSDTVLTYYLFDDGNFDVNPAAGVRVVGRVETIYCENTADAIKAAGDVFSNNQYNHLIETEVAARSKLIAVSSLRLYDKARVRTKSGVYNTYISAISRNNTDTVTIKFGDARLLLTDRLKGG